MISKKCLLAAAAMCMSAVMQIQAITISDEDKERARSLVSQMTLDEKIDYLSGETSFSLRPVERLGIPRVLLADGPQGIRNHCEHSTLFPSGILLASTWNRDMAQRYGESLGDDARARGVSILLGPGVNMYRSPLCGRNFEYMGEDPYLTSEVAVNYINGVQSRGVIATIKHFAGNNQEWNRHHASSDIDERTLNEIYFPAFRKAVQTAGVGAVMNSYNLLNGVHSTENRWLNTDVLREGWGFDGILMSDWTSVYSTVNAANSGLDLEMPKGVHFTKPLLKEALATGRVTEETIDKKVEHLLSTFIAFGILDREPKADGSPLDNEKSRATALDVARQGIVLLKNEGGILPFKGRTVVLGPNAGRIPTGGGSGFVSPFAVTTVADAMAGMSKKCVALTDDILYADVTGEIFTDQTCTTQGFAGKYFKNMELTGEPDAERVDKAIAFNWGRSGPIDGFPDDHFSAVWSGYYKPETETLLKIRISGDDGYRLSINGRVIAGDWGGHAVTSREVEYNVEAGQGCDIKVEYFDNISDASVECSIMALNEEVLNRELKKADNVVYCTGFSGDVEGEGFDRSFALPSYQEKFMKRIASVNPNMVVVVNAGGGIDFSAWDDLARGILLAWYPGQEGGQAVAEILTGKISPSGKLPISIESKLDDNPCAANYHKNAEPKERECVHVDYREGIFTGYRGYDRTGVKPRYPFGFGLGYSTFEFSNLALEKAGDGQVSVSFDVKNTGSVEAAEVAQVYVTDDAASVPRPAKELKGFEKVTLKPGQSRRVTVMLGKDAFEYYDLNQGRFILEPGQFTVSVGNSSDNLTLKDKIEL